MYEQTEAKANVHPSIPLKSNAFLVESAEIPYSITMEEFNIAYNKTTRN